MFAGRCGSRPITVVLTLGAIWVVVAVEPSRREGRGHLGEVTTYAKIVPFGGMAHCRPALHPARKISRSSIRAGSRCSVRARRWRRSRCLPFSDSNRQPFLPATWRDPHRTIPRATLLGILIATALYILGTIVVLGVVPREQLVHSTAPFADAASMMWGPWAAMWSRRGDHFIVRRTEWLDAAHGPGADGRSAGGCFRALRPLSPRGVPAFGIVFSAALATSWCSSRP